MKSSIAIAIGIALGCLLHTLAVANAQIKTSGIKTHYPAQGSGSLILGNATDEEYHYYDSSWNRSYVPADTYQPGDERHYVPPTRAPVFLDATAEFINKTRSAMASGICYKEVPTSSLVRNPSLVPAGNGTNPNMSKIQICCEGYQRNPHIYSRCDPICPDDCPNGICTAPNTCVCIPGHVRNYEDKCISVCPLGCGNGICDGRNECQCKPGYTIEPLNRKYCMPHCEQACAYGKCVAPNHCDCFDGYHLTAAGACEPHCDKCDNGKCTAPGFCSCNKGYVKVGEECEPVCSAGCTRGRCAAPDICECPTGSILDKSGHNCVPHCDQPCLNGVCEGGNTCVCNPGYVLDEYQRNICQPHCPNGCPNGFCTAPNFCICRPGFIKSGIKGHQTCVPI